jgi:hypothetical protein
MDEQADKDAVVDMMDLGKLPNFTVGEDFLAANTSNPLAPKAPVAMMHIDGEDNERGGLPPSELLDLRASLGNMDEVVQQSFPIAMDLDQDNGFELSKDVTAAYTLFPIEVVISPPTDRDEYVQLRPSWTVDHILGPVEGMEEEEEWFSIEFTDGRVDQVGLTSFVRTYQPFIYCSPNCVSLQRSHQDRAFLILIYHSAFLISLILGMCATPTLKSDHFQSPRSCQYSIL